MNRIFIKSDVRLGIILLERDVSIVMRRILAREFCGKVFSKFFRGPWSPCTFFSIY